MLGFEEKSLVVIGFETNDLDVFKVHVVACDFGVLVKTFLCSAIRVFGHRTHKTTQWAIDFGLLLGVEDRPNIHHERN